jgi:hypothetical protein
MRLSPLGMSVTNWPILAAPDDRRRVWSSRWNENWQGKSKYSEKTCPISLCSPQIPHDLTWPGTRAAAVGSRRVTAWAMVRPSKPLSIYLPMVLQPCVGPWQLLQFLDIYRVSSIPCKGDQPVARPLPAHIGQHKHTIKAHRHSCFKCDSNSRSQWLSGRRQFLP